MLESRPDWCISRQRTWGAPITLFVNKVDGSLHPNTVDLIEQVALRMRRRALMPGLILMLQTSWVMKPMPTRK